MAYQLIANAPPIPIIVVSGPALSFPGGVASNFDLAAAIAASVPSNETPIGVSTTPSLLAGLSTTVSPLRVVYDGAGAGGVLAQTDFLVRTQNYVIAYRVPSVTITSGTLTAPQNFQATSTLAPAAVLTWDAVPSATLYKVWRSVVDGPDAGYSLVNTVGPAPGFTDATVLHSGTYFFKISATLGATEGPRSVSRGVVIGAGFLSALPATTSFVRGTPGSFSFGSFMSDPTRSLLQKTGVQDVGCALVNSPSPPRIVYDGSGAGSESQIGTYQFVTDVELDWLARSTGPGVIWADDWRTSLAVTRWRRSLGTAYDPNGVNPQAPNVRRITTDGIGANQWCIELNRVGAASDGTMWIRSLSPSPGDLGDTRNYLDVRGVKTVVMPFPAQGSDIANWEHGLHAHPSYNNVNLTKDGNEYWVQYRQKVDPAWASLANGASGKTIYFDLLDGAQQEVPVQLNMSGGPYDLVLYTAGSPSLEDTSGPGSAGYLATPYVDPVTGITYAGDFSNSVGGAPGTVVQHWKHPYGIWDTHMAHFILGRDGVAETQIHFYAAHQGATQWTKTFQRRNLKLAMSKPPQSSHSPDMGHNSIKLSMYYENAGHSGYTRTAQMIVSRQAVALPAATA